MDIDKISETLNTIKVISGAIFFIMLGSLTMFIAVPLLKYQTIPINYVICIGFAIGVIVITLVVKLVTNITDFICSKLNEIAYNTKYKKI